jgi:endothelin-converting enzyme/putative endopeptidase
MEPLGGIGFFANIGPDAKNSNRNVISVGPGGVGLPDRDYYVSEDADSKEKRENTRFTLLNVRISWRKTCRS